MVPFHISLIFKVVKASINKKDEKSPAKINIEFLHPLMAENAFHVDFHLESGDAITQLQKLSVTVGRDEINGVQDKIREMMETWKSRKLGVLKSKKFYDKQEFTTIDSPPTLKNVKSQPKTNTKKKNVFGLLKAQQNAFE